MVLVMTKEEDDGAPETHVVGGVVVVVVVVVGEMDCAAEDTGVSPGGVGGGVEYVWLNLLLFNKSEENKVNIRRFISKLFTDSCCCWCCCWWWGRGVDISKLLCCLLLIMVCWAFCCVQEIFWC